MKDSKTSPIHGLRELRGYFTNLMGTHWEQTQKKIPPTSPPSPHPKPEK